MGLFEDDFYSTKIGRERDGGSGWGRGWRGGSGAAGWRWRGRRVGGRRGNGLVAGFGWNPYLLSAAAGACLVLLIVLPILMSRGGASAEPGAGAVAGGGYGDGADAIVLAADKVRPAVVSVLTTKGGPGVGGSAGGSGGSGGGSAAEREGFPTGMGSGVVFQKEKDKARVVTNNHVVEGASKVEVVLADGTRKKAVVLGRDVMTDLALLEIDSGGVRTVAEFGDSDKLRSAETAIAIGFPLGLSLSPTVTKGIISSPHRLLPISLGMDGIYDWELDVIQTDAAINQGNSGGPLVDIRGRVIGINSMKVSQTGVEGVGFALPINTVKPVIESLGKYGKVKRPYLGVASVELGLYAGKEGTDILKLPASVKRGIIVLESKGPSAAGGIRTNDVIVDMDGHEIGSTLELRKFLYEHKNIGDKVKVTYYRAGSKHTVTVVLGESPDLK